MHHSIGTGLLGERGREERSVTLNLGGNSEESRP